MFFLLTSTFESLIESYYCFKHVWKLGNKFKKYTRTRNTLWTLEIAEKKKYKIEKWYKRFRSFDILFVEIWKLSKFSSVYILSTLFLYFNEFYQLFVTGRRFIFAMSVSSTSQSTFGYWLKVVLSNYHIYYHHLYI